MAVMKNIAPNAALRPNPAIPFRAELARKIASFIGNEEKRITEIPGLRPPLPLPAAQRISRASSWWAKEASK
jgi:hypothetical protein